MYYSIELFIKNYMQRYKYYRILANNSISIYFISTIFDINQYVFIVVLMKICMFFNKSTNNT